MKIINYLFLLLPFQVLAQFSYEKQPNKKDIYNVEVRFNRSYGSIGSDGSGNDPDPAWQIKTANDVDYAANSLLNNSRTVAGIDNNAYCYWLTTSNNTWHPIQNDLLGVYSNNFTGRVDFEVMSYENDTNPVCVYNADPIGLDNINDDDNMAFLESQIIFTNNISGIYHSDERFIANGSRVEFNYLWRISRGERFSPLDFGSVDNCSAYLHTYTIRDQVEAYQSDQTFFKNDWTVSENANFTPFAEMTYVFYTDRDRRIIFDQAAGFNGKAHLIKVDSSMNFVEHFLSSSGSMDTTLYAGIYAIVMESGASSDTFDFSMRFEDAIHNPPTYSSNVIYVRHDAPVDGDGSSWANATPFLQAAINAADVGQQVWVSAGTYTPNSCNYSKLYFRIDKNIELYGGFKGVENSLEERVLGQDNTILSGQNSINTFNISKTILRIEQVNRTALLADFTIQNAAENAILVIGASPRIEQCNIMDNDGSGLAILASSDTSSFPAITNCLFANNHTLEIGGGLYMGGGLSSGNDATLINCIFRDNFAYYGGGAVALAGVGFAPKITLTNCTFHDNNADIGTAIFTIDSNVTSSTPTVTVRNSIFWNDAVENTNILGAYPFTHINLIDCLVPLNNSTELQGTSLGSITDVNSIFNQDPIFVNAAEGDLRIGHSSPAKDVGNPTFNSLDEDFWGRPRISGLEIDLGAFENQSKAYVNKNATVAGTGISWDSPAKELSLVLPESKEIWVAKGTYYPTTSGNRNLSFNIPDSTRLYGGFVGNEGEMYDLGLRDFELNETILSGDIGVKDDSTDNSFHVVTTTDVSNYTTVDGFTIQKGNVQDASFVQEFGGGWLNSVSTVGNSSSPNLQNLKFKHNSASFGGAFANIGWGNFETIFNNCLFEKNYASLVGGALYLLSSSAAVVASGSIKNTTFKNNRAEYGGAFILADNGETEIDSCIFIENNANHSGGAVYMSASKGLMHITLTNSHFENNTAGTNGGAMYCTSGGNATFSGEIGNSVFNNNSDKTTASDLFFDAWSGTIKLNFRRSVFYNGNLSSGNLLASLLNTGTYKIGFENSVFYGNRSSAFYKEGFVSNDSTRFNHCTFYGFEDTFIENINASTSVIDNSILWNSKAITNRFDLLTVSKSIVDTTLLNGVNGNLLADPKFIEPSAGVFYLNCGSPAINMGSGVDPLLSDITTFSRTGLPDVGAYEFRYQNIVENIANRTVSADIVNTNLTMSNAVNSPNYKIVQAENSILLEPGFQIVPDPNGTEVFQAKIGLGCP